MVVYRRAAEEDREPMIDFLNMVFSQAQRPLEMRTLLPKLYGDGQGRAESHVIAVDGGRIRGCAAMSEFTVRIADEELKAGYIGSVSAHSRDRGAGHMKALMKMLIDSAAEKKLDFLTLGGQRQRYGYFGFETAGIGYTYTVGEPNIRHALRDCPAEGYTFEAMTGADASGFAYEMFEKLPLHGTRRRDKFLITLKSWESEPYVILKDGKKIGYLVSNADTVNELLLTDYALTKNVVKAWWNARPSGGGLTFSAAPFMPELNAELASFSERSEISANGCLRMLEPANVIRAYMKLKYAAEGGLTDGRTVIGIDGKNVLIEVKDGIPNASDTAEAPEAGFTGAEAVRLIFSHNRFGAPAFAKKLPADWFPLPMYVMRSDRF